MFHRAEAERSAAVLLVIAGAFAFAGSGLAGHGPLPHKDPACTASPDPAAVGQPFTLSAGGLPTTDPVYLIVQAPSGTGGVGEVYVSGDGTWSGPEVANEAGTWTFTFSGLMNNNKYGAVSSCSVEAS